jgi:hypothetical protein
MKIVDYLDEDTGRIHKVMKTYNSNQYILRIPATIGRNPKFPFKHREVVRIRLEGERLIVEKLERKKE